MDKLRKHMTENMDAYFAITSGTDLEWNLTKKKLEKGRKRYWEVGKENKGEEVNEEKMKEERKGSLIRFSSSVILFLQPLLPLKKSAGIMYIKRLMRDNESN